MSIYKYIFGFIGLYLAALLSSCIENDIPYPYREGAITAFEVEGQLKEPEINTNNFTITVEVGDEVDIEKLRITKLEVTNEAAVRPDSARCNNFANFPKFGFASLDSLPKAVDTRINFSSPLLLMLSTYQDYQWKITINQVLEYSIEAENQYGLPVIDKINRQAIVYVAKTQKLDQINITGMVLGSKSSTITPTPATVHNFTRPQTFKVTQKNGNVETWKVTVLHTTEEEAKSDFFPMSTRAIVNGNILQGKTPVVEYKKTDAAEWLTVAEKDIAVKGTSFQAVLTGLEAGTSYVYRISIDGKAGAEQSFTTIQAASIPNGSFEDWWLEKNKIWNPWKDGGSSFWDTGNDGAATLGESNSYPTTETATGTGKAAKLESRFIGMAGIGKFAAGNMFSGEYVRTDGTNGILSFGRPFTSFPTALKLSYKYTSAKINYASTEYAALKDKPDTCSIYIALTDWDEPYEIRTKPSERQLFNKNDKHVIAYAELLSGQSSSAYQTVELKLDYRYLNRTPKYILIVASSSKYGDYFTGGTGSTLWLDEMELVYE